MAKVDDETVRVMDAEPVRPPLSVADAVMTCVPPVRVLVMVAPVPSATPLSFHAIELDRLPSWVSVAEAVKVIRNYRIGPIFTPPVMATVTATPKAITASTSSTSASRRHAPSGTRRASCLAACAAPRPTST